MPKRKVVLPVMALFLISIFCVTCAKEYSYEGGPRAQYSIAGSPTECSPAIISGSYLVGVPLDSSNFLQVTANVTLRGSYQISTVPVNGLTFSASGRFSDTGKNIVKLLCSGKPLNEGTFEINIPGNNGCHVTLKVGPKKAASYILNSTTGECSSIAIKGPYIQNTALTNLNTIDVSVTVLSAGTYNIHTDSVNGISFSASGIFTKVGIQTVTLTSKGTPGEVGLADFIVRADSAQCNFNIPVAPKEPLAVYVLESNAPANTCNFFAVNGNYLKGSQLNSTNTVGFTVYVKTPGNFSISTSKVDGIYFSASGQFTGMGQQVVTLKGNGVPVASGTYDFAPSIIGPAPLGGVVCHFSISVQ